MEHTPREIVNIIKRAGDNAKIPGIARVSSLYAPFQDFSAIPADVLNAAADRGTKVHTMIACYLKKKEIPSHFGEEVEGYYRSWLMWGVADDLLADKDTEVAAECPVGNSDLRGTADMLAVAVKGDYVRVDIWDWKTTSSPSPWHRFQTFVYGELVRQSIQHIVDPNHLIMRRNVLYLKPYESGYEVSTGMKPCENVGFEKILYGLVEVNKVLWENNPKMRKEIINTHYNELHGGSE